MAFKNIVKSITIRKMGIYIKYGVVDKHEY
jgi:hypothetical protein